MDIVVNGKLYKNVAKLFESETFIIEGEAILLSKVSGRDAWTCDPDKLEESVVVVDLAALNDTAINPNLSTNTAVSVKTTRLRGSKKD